PEYAALFGIWAIMAITSLLPEEGPPREPAMAIGGTLPAQAPPRELRLNARLPAGHPSENPPIRSPTPVPPPYNALAGIPPLNLLFPERPIATDVLYPLSFDADSRTPGTSEYLRDPFVGLLVDF